MDIVEKLQVSFEAKGYVYRYGTKSVLNLYDGGNDDILQDTKCAFLLPVVRRPAVNQYGGLERLNYQVSFMMLNNSQLDIEVQDNGDQYYYQKYIYKILPLLKEFESMVKAWSCTDLIFTNIEITEVVNELANNMDGLFIRCQISYQA
jgi:hypothetical protein